MGESLSYKNLPESVFLVDFFRKINAKSIRYCVLRNYEELPYSAGGSDIDILIEGSHFSAVCKLLVSIAQCYGGQVISRLKADRVVSLSLCGIYDQVWWGVKFDLFSAYVGTNGCDILPSDDVLERSFEHNGVIVADENDGAVVAFIKEIIGAGQTRKNYAAEALHAFAENRLRYEKPLRYYWGNEVYKDLVEPLLCGEITDLVTVRKRLKRGWLFNMLLQQPLRVIKSRMVDFSFRVSRFFSPSGFAIAFIGTDGSGKSTIIKGIRPPLESALHARIKYEHMRPNLLPSLARLLGGEPRESGKPVSDPHGSTTSGFLGSFFRLAYYSLDYIFGYGLKVYPDKVRKTCLYVFDRYFYDFIIDPVRSRISLSKKIVECFRVMIPEPDLVLCLGAAPEVIHVRKPELPLKEVIRQVDELRKFCDETHRAVWVDTGLPVEKSLDQALSAIVDRMAARYD